jgi:hypothetical protein
VPHYSKGSGSFIFLFYNLFVLFVNCYPSVLAVLTIPQSDINVKFMLKFENKARQDKTKGQKHGMFSHLILKDKIKSPDFFCFDQKNGRNKLRFHSFFVLLQVKSWWMRYIEYI